MQPFFAGFFGGWMILLILAEILILFGAKNFPDLTRGFGKGLEEFKKETGEIVQELRDGVAEDTEPKKPGALDSLLVWMAWGFDIGRIPCAPGTFGSLMGLLWFAILLSTQNIWFFTMILVTALIVSIWICGKAEEILRQRDPSSIVLDEICAMPLCFVPCPPSCR